MYLLDACMVLLHVLISNISPFPTEEVVENLEMSIEIFKAMKMLAVARRCAEIVTELLHVATRANNPVGNHRQTNAQMPAETEPLVRLHDEATQIMHTSPLFIAEDVGAHRGEKELGENLIPGDFDANLVDPNVVWNFLNFEHWNAWSDAAFR